MNRHLRRSMVAQTAKGMHPMVDQLLGRQEPAAWPNGSRVRKVGQHTGDTHGPGALATVLGSVGPLVPDAGVGPATMIYLVEWDDAPGLPVVCAEIGKEGPRLELVAEQPS